MLKRIIDIVLSFVAIVILLMPGMVVLLIKWLEDKSNPIYPAKRVTQNGKVFTMYKIRTMVPNAECLGGSSTSNSDSRITAVGGFLRAYKLDEVLQFINVLKGDLSFVGPRPTTVEEYESFSIEEKSTFSVKAGLTDFSSIIFSDEGLLLHGSKNPDALYQSLIRPWKSELGILYAKIPNTHLDILLIYYTMCNFFSRQYTLRRIYKLLLTLNAKPSLCEFVLERVSELDPN